MIVFGRGAEGEDELMCFDLIWMTRCIVFAVFWMIPWSDLILFFVLFEAECVDAVEWISPLDLSSDARSLQLQPAIGGPTVHGAECVINVIVAVAVTVGRRVAGSEAVRGRVQSVYRVQWEGERRDVPWWSMAVIACCSALCMLLYYCILYELDLFKTELYFEWIIGAIPSLD